MKLNNFESALLYYSKGWFKLENNPLLEYISPEESSEIHLRRIFNTIYYKYLKDPIYSSHVAKVLIELIYKIAPTQHNIHFPIKGYEIDFLAYFLEDLSPNPFFETTINLSSTGYWERVIEKLFNILSLAMVCGTEMEEEIEIPVFEEILAWVNNNQLINFEEYLKDNLETNEEVL